MNRLPKTYGEIESFVTMLLAACEDAGMNETLEMLLSQPDDRRQAAVDALLEHFREKGAPRELVEAFAPLLDDAVAEKAYEIIHRCRRKPGGETPG